MITRKPGQSFLLGDQIEVKILRVRGDDVRVGVNAPTTVPVLRKELLTGGTTNRGRRMEEVMRSSFYSCSS